MTGLKEFHTTVTYEHVEPSRFCEPVWNPLDYLVDEDPYLDDDVLDRIIQVVEHESLRQGIEFDSNKEVSDFYWGMEVGDDRVDVAEHPEQHLVALAIQSVVYGMKTSQEDTYVSNRDWNFCEVTSMVPCAVEQGFNYARKTSLNHLGYIDVPPIRIIIDVQKGDRSHSSTTTGKAQLLGRKLSTPRTSMLSRLHLASWIQDGCLNTRLAPDPKYLHKHLGGSGVPPIASLPENAYLYVRAYKGGSYSRVYGTAINELKKAVDDMDAGRPPLVVLSRRLRDKQEYLHATYAEKVFILPKDLKSRWEDFPDPIYNGLGTEAGIQALENRLIQSRRLITRKQAEVEVSRTRRIASTLFNPEGIEESDRLERELSKSARRKYEGALQANSAVQRLLSRKGNDSDVTALVSEGFLTVTSGVRDITLWDISWMCRGKGISYTIDDIPFPEDMYIRTEVSTEETMRISGIPLSTIMNRGPPRFRLTEARIGLWQVSKSQEEWSDDIIKTLTSLRAETGSTSLPREAILEIFDNKREWVSDDAMIISRAVRDTKGQPLGTILLISSDEKLGRNIAQITGFYVCVVSPAQVLINERRESWTYEDMIDIGPRVLFYMQNAELQQFPYPSKVYVDTGSFQAHASRVVEGTNGHGIHTNVYYAVTLQSADYTAEGRQSVRKFEKLHGPKPYQGKLISPNTEVVRISFVKTETPIEIGRERSSFYERLRRRFSRKKT